jgi:hypothetical protein
VLTAAGGRLVVQGHGSRGDAHGYEWLDGVAGLVECGCQQHSCGKLVWHWKIPWDFWGACLDVDDLDVLVQ